MPRVSVVLPSYNYARYLDERIRSLLGQSYRDFELVIVDDASTDESLEVIARFRDPRIKLHVRTENSGKVYASWNEGLGLCSGELVLFAGADDVAEGVMLERLVEPFEGRERLGMSHCRFLSIDGAGRITGTQMPLSPAAAFILEDLHHDYLAEAPVEWRRLLVTNFIWNASGVLLRREAVERAGGFDDRLLIAADWLLYLSVAREYDVAYRAEPLNAFRQLDKSVSKRMQGAVLMGEIYDCITRQERYLRAPEDRACFETGLAVADGGLSYYAQLNRQHGQLDEVARLTSVAERYGRVLAAGLGG
ncbi:MAG TPA: glycosyltransferase [Candidatus Dormibacteraeota bacterium]|nr:glycosyltransferase [Candidatus Dormibacteraeota bacterium]